MAEAAGKRERDDAAGGEPSDTAADAAQLTAPKQQSLRRSTRRESTPRASSSSSSVKSVDLDAEQPETAALSIATTTTTTMLEPPTTTRRSRRQVKSTYATTPGVTPGSDSLNDSRSVKQETVDAALDTNNPGNQESMTTLTAGGEGDDGGDDETAKERVAAETRAKAIEERINKRRRPQSGGSGLMDNDGVAPMSPPTASGSSGLVAPSSASRRRRPAGRHTSVDANSDGDAPSSAGVTVMGNADVSVRTQMQKALGRYTARECTLLCEVILQQIKDNSTNPTVLECDPSPAHIRWDQIAQKMLTLHRLSISPRDAQELWKFLAYGEQPSSIARSDGSPHNASCELLPASDDEDYDLSVDAINEKHNEANRPIVNPVTGNAESGVSGGDAAEREAPANTDTTLLETQPNEPVSAPDETKHSPLEEESAHTKTQLAPHQAAPMSAAVEAAQETRVPPASQPRLYPVYELPTGAPDGWQKPFKLQEMLPLTFVAGKFLKKRADLPTAADAEPLDAASSGVVAATAVGDAGQQAQEKPKKKRGRKAEAKAKAANDGSVATQGEQKKPKQTKKASTPGTTAKVQTPSSTRAPYVPSSTPPPQASPPRDAFQFFSRMYEEDPASVLSAEDAPTKVVEAAASNGSTVAEKPTTSFIELQALFAKAPARVRSACQKLALEDLDRYNRECVRRRIWEKAMSSQTNSPMPSPLPATATSTPGNSSTTSSRIPSLTIPAAVPGPTVVSAPVSKSKLAEPKPAPAIPSQATSASDGQKQQ